MFRIVSKEALAWPAHDVEIKVGENLIRRIPGHVLRLLKGWQEGGFLTIEELPDAAVPSAESAAPSVTPSPAASHADRSGGSRRRGR